MKKPRFAGAFFEPEPGTGRDNRVRKTSRAPLRDDANQWN